MRDERLFGGAMINPFWAKAHLPGHRRTWRRLTVCLAALGLLLAFLGPAVAGDGALDPSFNKFQGVSKIPLIRGQANWTAGGYPAGNSLIFGYFTSITDSISTHSVNSIAKLTDFNGTVDTNFQNPSNPHPWTINGEVRGVYLESPAAVPNSTQDIILWGAFTLTDTTTSKIYYNLARLTWNSTDSAYVVDTGFPQIFNAGGLVNAFALMGGYLSSYALVGGYNMQVPNDTSHAYHLIRLNNNLIYDSTYGPTNAYTQAKSLPGGIVTAMVVSSNQPRIVGTLPVGDGSGNFHWWEAFDSTTSGFQKSLGTNSPSGTNYGPIDGPIINMAQTSTGQWIIVGAFKSVFNNYNPNYNRVAQLTSDLSALDNSNSFNTNIGSGADHAVQQILIQGPTGQVILAGGFTGFNGIAYGHIVRLYYDSTHGYGTVDTSFNYSSGNPTAGADDRIFKLFGFATSSTQNYFQILGSFQKYNSTARSGIATLNPGDGSLYTSSYPNPPFAANSNTPGTVYALETTWNTNGPLIVLGGDFTGVNGKYHQNLAYLNPDGSLDTTHSSTVFEGPVKSIRGVQGSDGQILVAGNFGQAQAYGCTGVARLNQDGTFDHTFRPIVWQANGTVADVHSADTDDNVSGDYVIMGNFAYAYDYSHNSWSRQYFARLNLDGSLDANFNAQISIPNSSNIYVNTGGSFGNGNYGMVGYYKNTSNNSDCGFACVLGQFGVQQTYMTFNGEVLCAGGHGGKSGGVVVGGNFTQVLSPVSANRGHIAALTSNFTLDTISFTGAGADHPIYALRAQGDNDQGNLLIGGIFTSYNGISRNGVARLTLGGSLDNSFNPGIGVNGPVYAIQWSNKRAVIGGAFTSYNGVSMPGVAQVFASLGASPAANILLLLGD